ncbi:PREDICTED: uncharacterized protein LOC105152143 [Acromyrmex echinatior]|uniref:Uncharacterized protein n=1 Tax=Acromyrmex echinatior TaxID=103372 RepID=F4X2X8_ACREC|nr:PREDICTED: uncharacterized protein LOC105152143 [Acromyrmex echinatior]EGI59199.1 hypothetical protein G5I_12661 [Acromyrmex echinatior]
MENCIVNESINNDFLSQSYLEGIERITGTKGSIFNFQIPEKLLEVRKKTWDNLLNKYSKEMSDDIELNVDTLEPVEDEENKVVSEGEYSCGQRIPMRKPATFVQYWINTGNPPYKTLLDENELSEAGSSLSEKEIASLSVSPVTNTDKSTKCKNDSSCSSVDTAAYILSNANITKKADTIAIIKGAKCVEVKSLKEVAVKDIGVSSNNKIKYMEITPRIDRVITHKDNDNDNVNVDILDTEPYPMSTECMAADICGKVAASTLISSNAIQSNVYSQNLSCEETDKTDESNISQRNSNIQTIDKNIASIFRRFDKTSKRLIVNDKNNDVSDLGQNKVLDMDFHKKQVSENVHEIIARNTSLTTLHRKKLYTGRDSPVDLILTETHGANRLSGAKQSLHPALDLDSTIKGEPFLTHKGKSKHSLSAKTNLGSKKIKGKGRRELNCISNEIITEISNKDRNDNKIQDTTIDSSFKNLSDFHDNSNKQDDITFREYNDINISVRNEDFSKQNVASLNLKPVVLLERIQSFNRYKLGENTHIAQKEDVCNRNLNKSKKLHSCKIKNLESETIDSDESTILIYQCNTNSSQCVSSLSDCSLDLRLDVEDNFSVSNAEKKDDKLSNLKNTDVSHNKELHVEGLLSKKNYSNAAMESNILNKTNAIWQNVSSNKSKTYSYLYGRNDMNNVKLREIKIVLERLPLSVKNCTSTITEMQIFNRNNAAIWEKGTLNKSETHFSNLYGTTEKDNVKFQEIRVLLERLPANICLKENSNVTNINIFPNKKISQNTGLQTNRKRESKIRKISKSLACKNEVAIPSDHDNYSSKMNIKSKKDNDKINGTYDIVAQRGSQIFDKVESEFTFQHKTFQYKNCNKASQDDRGKYSILTFTSSDEDDFVRSIQHPRKRSKMSANDILGEPNIAEKDLYDQTKLVIRDKDKYSYSRNLSTVIRSSEKTVQRDSGLIKKKKEHSNNTQTRTTSLELLKNEEFVFSSSEGDNGNVADNSNKAKKKILFFNSKENMSNNSLRHSNETIKKNGIDYKDNTHVIIFQTKTFDTNSSDSEESNSYTSSTRKVLMSSTHNRLRYHDSINSEEIFNDSLAKKYSKRHLGSLNSSLEKHSRTHNGRIKFKSINKEVKTNKQLANKESNSDIKLRISDTRKDASFSSLINNRPVTSVQKTTLSNTLGILEEINLLKNKEISEKSKNSVAIQTFQTKSYYDSSDSSETM